MFDSVKFEVKSVPVPTVWDVVVYSFETNGTTHSADTLTDNQYSALVGLVFEQYNDGKLKL